MAEGSVVGGEIAVFIILQAKCNRQVNRIGVKTYYLVPSSIHSHIFWNYIPNFP